MASFTTMYGPMSDTRPIVEPSSWQVHITTLENPRAGLPRDVREKVSAIIGIESNHPYENTFEFDSLAEAYQCFRMLATYRGQGLRYELREVFNFEDGTNYEVIDSRETEDA